MQNKPREWFLSSDAGLMEPHQTYRATIQPITPDDIHVTEYSAFEAAIKERNEFKAAADIISAANDRLEDLLHKMTEERDEARDELVAQTEQTRATEDLHSEVCFERNSLRNAAETERSRSAKLVEAASNLMRNFSSQLEAQIHAPGFKHIRLEPTLVEALGDALAEYEKGEAGT